MEVNAYKPAPLDVSNIALPEELDPLIEQIAHNVHEVWAETRLHQGWVYGPERNDRLKTHPSIIPYDNLSEDEKVFDRNTAVNTLKLIVKLGFKIVK